MGKSRAGKVGGNRHREPKAKHHRFMWSARGSPRSLSKVAYHQLDQSLGLKGPHQPGCTLILGGMPASP